MSLANFKLARQTRVSELPFDTLIMAATIKAKHADFERVRAAFPGLVGEAISRMHSEGGILPAGPAGAR